MDPCAAESRLFGKKKRKSKGRAVTDPSVPPGDIAQEASGGTSGEGPPEASAGPPTGEPGSRIGRYTVESTLGQGSMGKVYLARDPVIGRNVALKVISIRPDLGDDEAAQF